MQAEPNGPLARYVKVRAAHAPGMPGSISPPTRVSNPDMPHGPCVTHVPWYMLRSLTSGFHWSQWWGKLSRCMRNTQFYVSLLEVHDEIIHTRNLGQYLAIYICIRASEHSATDCNPSETFITLTEGIMKQILFWRTNFSFVYGNVRT